MSVSVTVESATAPHVERAAGMFTAWQIARVEGLRLVRHPLVIGSIVLGAALLVGVTWMWAPVLNRHDGMTVDALMPLAGTMLIVAHLAASRSIRHGTTELYCSSPARLGVVTVGHLLSLAWAFGLALCVALAQLVYLKSVGGVGTPRPSVVLTGPALVLLGGALGVALGRFVRKPYAGPLALIGLVALLAGLLNTGSLGPREVAESLSPYIPMNNWGSGVGELSMRPLGLHLAYVLSLAAAASLIAVARTNRSFPVIVPLCVALALSAVFVERRAVPPTRAQEMALAAPFLEPGRHRTCEIRSGIRYCAYPSYVPWIDGWASVVGSVLAAAPPAAQPKGFAVTQLSTNDELYGSDAHAAANKFWRLLRQGALGSPQEVHPGLWWGRNAAEGEFELALALKVAERVTRMDADFKVTKKDLESMPRRARRMIGTGRFTSCVVFGQGRAVVAMWLAAEATPRARGAFVDAFAPVGWPSPYQIRLAEYQYQLFGYSALGVVTWGTREAEYAKHLLQRDASEVESLVRTNWARLTDPRTTSEQAAAILGLDRLDPGGSAERQAMNYGAPLCR